MAHVVTKSDLVQVAAKAGNVSKAAAGEAVNAVFDAIVSNVAKGKRVTVVGFGTFLPRRRKARAGRSVTLTLADGSELEIGALSAADIEWKLPLVTQVAIVELPQD